MKLWKMFHEDPKVKTSKKDIVALAMFPILCITAGALGALFYQWIH